MSENAGTPDADLVVWRSGECVAYLLRAYMTEVVALVPIRTENARGEPAVRTADFILFASSDTRVDLRRRT